MEFLIRKGANVKNKDNFGKTILDYVFEDKKNTEEGIDEIHSTLLYMVRETILYEDLEDRNNTEKNFDEVYSTPLNISNLLHEESDMYNFETDLVSTAKYVSTICEVKSALLPCENIKKLFTNNKNFQFESLNLQIHKAAKENKLRYLEFLIGRGINVNCKDKKGKTPLHYAVTITDPLSRYEAVMCLLGEGACYNALDKDRKTPLDYVEGDNENSVRVLLKLLSELFETDSKIREIMDGSVDIGDRWMAIINARDSDGNTLLHKFTSRNKVDVAEYLLEVEYSIYIENYINAENKLGHTPLHIAVKNGFFEIAQLLLKQGAIYNLQNDSDQIPKELTDKKHRNDFIELFNAFEKIFDAVELDRKSQIEDIYNRYGRQLDCGLYFVTNAEGMTPLHRACEKGLIDIVKFLIKRNSGAVFFEDVHGKRSLHYAADNAHTEIVRLLLEKGAPFNSRNKKGQTVLEVINNQNCPLLSKIVSLFTDIQNDSPQAVLDILKRETTSIADLYTVTHTEDDRSFTLLHHAANEDDYEIVLFLLSHGAPYDALNCEGQMPGKLAHNLKIIFLLRFVHQLFQWEAPLVFTVKQIKQDLNLIEVIRGCRNSEGKSILNYCAKHYFRLKFLIEIGLDVNYADRRGRTPLHTAAIDGNLRATRLLIDSGAKVDAEDDEGYAALNYAASRRHWSVVIYLVDRRGATVNDAILDGKTILQEAEEDGEQNVIELLRGKKRTSQALSLQAPDINESSCVGLKNYSLS